MLQALLNETIRKNKSAAIVKMGKGVYGLKEWGPGHSNQHRSPSSPIVTLHQCKHIDRTTKRLQCSAALRLHAHKRGYLAVACDAGHQWVWCAHCCDCSLGMRGCIVSAHWMERDSFDTGTRNHMQRHFAGMRKVKGVLVREKGCMSHTQGEGGKQAMEKRKILKLARVERNTSINKQKRAAAEEVLRGTGKRKQKEQLTQDKRSRSMPVKQGICEHQRRRSRCKECGGGSICRHQRRKDQCTECGGSSICQHKRIRSMCEECRGPSICQHQRERDTCKECEQQIANARRLLRKAKMILFGDDS